MYSTMSVLIGIIFKFSWVLCQYPYFVCPIEYNEVEGRMTMECEPSVLFRPTEYTLPGFLSGILQMVSKYYLFRLVALK